VREISLHILDLMENAIRAGATVISVTVEEEPDRDLLAVTVEDNGFGPPVPAETAAGERTGLGLSLLKSRTEQAGGCFRLDRSCLGGLAVQARMPLSGVNRSPLGDLAATLASVVCTNPEVEVRSLLRVGAREWQVSTEEIARALPAGSRSGIDVARRMRERIAEGLSTLHVTD
jgi:hypothetical protein